MLQAIRSKAGSLIVKILFALLIVSFGVWGIADVFRQRTAAETTVADVGDMKIKADELQREINRELEQMRRMFGGSVSMEQAKQLGILDGVLNRMIATDLLTLEQRRLQITLSNEVVKKAIVTNANFRNSLGVFDADIFRYFLANNQLSESRFMSLLRDDIERAFVTGAITAGATPPDALVDPLFRRQNETRVADTVFIAADKVAGVAAPGDADLETYYNDHPEAFRSPEYRGFAAVIVRPDDMAAEIDVPEDKIRKEYESRQDEFQTPERREIEQILVSDEAKAKEVETALAEGKDFAAVAKDVAGQDENAIKFGWVERKEMPPALADAAFALGKGETSKPVQDPLGWHILRVTNIEGGGAKPFEEVKDQLKTDIAREIAADDIFKLHNQIEDALAGGATLEQIAEKLKVKLETVAAVDLDGRTPTGDIASVNDAAILHAVFNTDQGQTSRLTETKDNGYFLVRTDSVTPAKLKPLAEVKDKAKELWLAEKRNAAAEAEAKAIAAAVGQGKSLADLAAEKQLTVATTPPVLRTGGGQETLPATLVARIFELKEGEAGVSEGNNGWFVAVVKKIAEPDPAADKVALDQLKQQVTQGVQSDLLAEFDKALRSRYSVSVNQKEIDRLF